MGKGGLWEPIQAAANRKARLQEDRQPGSLVGGGSRSTAGKGRAAPHFTLRESSVASTPKSMKSRLAWDPRVTRNFTGKVAALGASCAEGGCLAVALAGGDTSAPISQSSGSTEVCPYDGQRQPSNPGEPSSTGSVATCSGHLPPSRPIHTVQWMHFYMEWNITQP